MMPTYLKLTV